MIAAGLLSNHAMLLGSVFPPSSNPPYTHLPNDTGSRKLFTHLHHLNKCKSSDCYASAFSACSETYSVTVSLKLCYYAVKTLVKKRFSLFGQWWWRKWHFKGSYSKFLHGERRVVWPPIELIPHWGRWSKLFKSPSSQDVLFFLFLLNVWASLCTIRSHTIRLNSHSV